MRCVKVGSTVGHKATLFVSVTLEVRRHLRCCPSSAAFHRGVMHPCCQCCEARDNMASRRTSCLFVFVKTDNQSATNNEKCHSPQARTNSGGPLTTVTSPRSVRAIITRRVRHDIAPFSTASLRAIHPVQPSESAMATAALAKRFHFNTAATHARPRDNENVVIEHSFIRTRQCCHSSTAMRVIVIITAWCSYSA